MNILERWNRILQKEDGNVLVIFAVFLMVMIGFAALVVDFGGLKLEQNRLINVADAAALAGARELPDTNMAKQIAEEYARFNGATDDEITVSFPNGSGEIKVEARREKEFFFGKALGVTAGTASANATAAYGAVSGMSGIVPFSIPDQELEYGVEYELKAGSHDDYGPGNYGALALGLKGASSYRNNIRYGYDGIVRVGEWIETEPGNMSGPTEDGVEYRINQCQHTPECTFDNHHPDCSKVMIVPIYDPASIQGRDEVYIVGFGAFFLKEVRGQGNNSSVVGYFIELVPPEGLYVETDPNQDYYGVAKARLIE